MEPNHAAAWYNRGIAYENMGLRSNAESDFSKAIELDPSFTQAYSSRTIANKKAGSSGNPGKK
jgi:lipoprotein NlpI